MYNKIKQLSKSEKGLTLAELMFTTVLIALLIIGFISAYYSENVKQEEIQTSKAIVTSLENLESRVSNLSDFDNTPLKDARVDENLLPMVKTLRPPYPLMQNEETPYEYYTTPFDTPVNYFFYSIQTNIRDWPFVNLVTAKLTKLSESQCFNIALNTAPKVFLTRANGEFVKMTPEPTEFSLGRNIVVANDLKAKCNNNDENVLEFIYYRNPMEPKAPDGTIVSFIDQENEYLLRQKYLKRHKYLIDQREIIQKSLN